MWLSRATYVRYAAVGVECAVFCWEEKFFALGCKPESGSSSPFPAFFDTGAHLVNVRGCKPSNDVGSEIVETRATRMYDNSPSETKQYTEPCAERVCVRCCHHARCMRACMHPRFSSTPKARGTCPFHLGGFISPRP